MNIKLGRHRQKKSIVNVHSLVLTYTLDGGRLSGGTVILVPLGMRTLHQGGLVTGTHHRGQAPVGRGGVYQPLSA